MFEPYVDEDFYKTKYLGKVTKDLAQKIKQAQQHTDALTFNRIVGIGFENLTPFRQSVIKEVICQQVDFEDENRELLDSVLTSYSINGVSMNFGNNWNVMIQNGIAMKRSTFELLKQTGLTNRVIK